MELSELTRNDKVTALTNIVMVMYADGKVRPEELEYLEKLRKRLGLTKEEVDDICRNPERLSLVIPGTVNEKIFQLINMIFMMKADGEIHPSERDLCVKFALAIRLPPLKVAQLIDAATRGLKQGHSRAKTCEDTTLIIDK